MRRSNFALRLQPSLMEEVRKAAVAEGVALNQLINVAVAEKISALRTEQYFRERSLRANRAETMQILARAGLENEPVADDELPGASNGARKTRKNPPPAGNTVNGQIRERKKFVARQPEMHAYRIF